MDILGYLPVNFQASWWKFASFRSNFIIFLNFFFQHDSATVSADVDLNMGGPMVNAAGVIGHNG